MQCYLRLARYSARARRSSGLILPSYAGMRDMGFCDFGFRMNSTSQSAVWAGFAPTRERSGPRPRPGPPRPGPPPGLPPPSPIRWQRAQPFASNTFRPAATGWESPPVGSGWIGPGPAPDPGPGWTGPGPDPNPGPGPGGTDLPPLLSATWSVFFPEGQKTTARVTPTPTATRSTTPPIISGRLLEACFRFLRRLRRRGRSSTSSSGYRSSGGGAALRGRAPVTFAEEGRSPPAGTGKGVPHFGHLIIFPTGNSSETLRPASQDGQASFFSNTVVHLTFVWAKQCARVTTSLI
jgi:hypothetical protein